MNIYWEEWEQARIQFSDLKGKVYIGIDIGKLGGIAIKYENMPIVLIPMPKIGNEVDYHALISILKGYPVCHVIFERLTSIFKTSKAATWSLAHQSGAIEAGCIALNIPYTKCPPKDWQKDMFFGIPEIVNTNGKRETKKMALVAVKRLYPTMQLTFKNSRVPHEGCIDATLMVTWAQRKNL